MPGSVHEILHIAPRVAWEAAKQAGVYAGDTLASEAFIHCSALTEVMSVADARFQGRTDLIVLVIDARRVGPEVRWEEADGQVFPHIYGPLNLDAVFKVLALEPGPDGRFAFPDQVIEEQRDGRFVAEEEGQL